MLYSQLRICIQHAARKARGRRKCTRSTAAHCRPLAIRRPTVHPPGVRARWRIPALGASTARHAAPADPRQRKARRTARIGAPPHPRATPLQKPLRIPAHQLQPDPAQPAAHPKWVRLRLLTASGTMGTGFCCICSRMLNICHACTALVSAARVRHTCHTHTCTKQHTFRSLILYPAFCFFYGKKERLTSGWSTFGVPDTCPVVTHPRASRTSTTRLVRVPGPRLHLRPPSPRLQCSLFQDRVCAAPSPASLGLAHARARARICTCVSARACCGHRTPSAFAPHAPSLSPMIPPSTLTLVFSLFPVSLCSSPPWVGGLRAAPEVQAAPGLPLSRYRWPQFPLLWVDGLSASLRPLRPGEGS